MSAQATEKAKASLVISKKIGFASILGWGLNEKFKTRVHQEWKSSSQRIRDTIA